MARSNSPKQWERQENESQEQYDLFCIYRDMKAQSVDKKRTLERVQEQCGKSESWITKLSSRFNWKERAEAWDAELDRIALEETKKEMLKEIRQMRKRQAEAGKFMQIKAIKALSRIPEEEIKPGDISRLVDIGSKLERLARGDVGDVIEERNGGEAVSPVQIYIPSNSRENKDDFDDLEV